MSPNTAATVRLFAFGDLEAGPWGVAATAERGSFASFAPSASADGSGPQEPWRLEADGSELEFSPVAEPAALDLGGTSEGFVQLAHVRGRLAAGTVECFGVRAIGDAPQASFQSIRGAAGWTGADEGFALVALRPQGTNGHEGDHIGAAVFEAGQALPVTEPRLSTAYGPHGTPVRAGLELWLEEPVQEVAEENGEPPRQFPRRAAGEALGDAAQGAAGALELRAELFRWHLRGESGAGVYVLAQSR